MSAAVRVVLQAAGLTVLIFAFVVMVVLYHRAWIGLLFIGLVFAGLATALVLWNRQHPPDGREQDGR